MKKIVLVLLLVGGLGVMSVSMVQADPINVGDPLWYQFQWNFNTYPGFGTAGGGISGTQVAPNPPWTYTAATGTIVSIVDTALNGDVFRLWDGTTPVGATSPSTYEPLFYLSPSAGPAAALTHPELSRGFFTLAAGTHSLTIEIIQTPYDSQGPNAVKEGVAFFRVDAATAPLPPSAWLLGSGLLGLIGFRRFRKS